MYLLPTFSGALADRIGFKNALLLAFILLTIGYLSLGVFPKILEAKGLVEYGRETNFTGLRDSNAKFNILPIMLIIMVGGSFIKSVISGTVAKETTQENRAKGFSVFYMMVNIGAFSGRTLVEPLRLSMGNLGLIHLNYFSAGMTFIALIIIFFFYKTSKHESESKSFKEIWAALLKVLTNGKLITLILIMSGFWMVQQQLYASMPKYVLRLAGEGTSPSWYANVNPVIVVLFVGLVTQMMRKRTALFSMTVGMFIMPFSSLLMASGNMLNQTAIDFGFAQIHPVAVMMMLGIAIQGFAETFISPRFLEYFSLQAPKGEEAMYLGFSQLTSFFSSIFGFGLSGFLLNKYCPDPTLFPTHEAWQLASANAHHIWYYFMTIAFTAGIALIIYGKFVNKSKI